jgi:hypothetical protein
MDFLSTTPYNNAVHYYVRENGHGETIFMVTRLLYTDFYWFVELVCVGRFAEGVLLKESSVRHGERQLIVAASVVLSERSRKTGAHACLDSFWLQECEFVLGDCERKSYWRSLLRVMWVVTVDGEDSRSSVLVNGSLVTDYPLRCCSSVQVDPIARRWIVLTCLESCCLYLTVVCWVLEWK